MVLGQTDASSTKHRFNPCRHLSERERLDNIVISPQFEAGNSLGFEAPSGEEDRGDITNESKFSKHVAAVFGTEDNVEQDQVGTL